MMVDACRIQELEEKLGVLQNDVGTLMLLRAAGQQPLLEHAPESTDQAKAQSQVKDELTMAAAIHSAYMQEADGTQSVTKRCNVAELMRYHTSKTGDEMISLTEYVTRMQEGQDDIY